MDKRGSSMPPKVANQLFWIWLMAFAVLALIGLVCLAIAAEPLLRDFAKEGGSSSLDSSEARMPFYGLALAVSLVAAVCLSKAIRYHGLRRTKEEQPQPIRPALVDRVPTEEPEVPPVTKSPRPKGTASKNRRRPRHGRRHRRNRR